MKLITMRSVLPAAIVSLSLLTTASAHHRISHASSNGQLEGKLLYCKTCHGLQGQGFRGYFPIPRLAGQQKQYIANQIRAFLDHRRIHPVMSIVAGGVAPWMIDRLAGSFSGLNPPPYGGAPRGDLALGKRIFFQGLPDSNVPACFACHGPDAHGHNEIPRLAGQLYWYTVAALSKWTSERGRGAPDISRIMVPTTHNLTHKQIEAVAAYLSTLR
jgi:cytochrome c553